MLDAADLAIIETLGHLLTPVEVVLLQEVRDLKALVRRKSLDIAELEEEVSRAESHVCAECDK